MQYNHSSTITTLCPKCKLISDFNIGINLNITENKKSHIDFSKIFMYHKYQKFICNVCNNVTMIIDTNIIDQCKTILDKKYNILCVYFSDGYYYIDLLENSTVSIYSVMYNVIKDNNILFIDVTYKDFVTLKIQDTSESITSFDRFVNLLPSNNLRKDKLVIFKTLDKRRASYENECNKTSR